MRIACLQFSPQVGDVDNNLNRADAVLSKANPQNLDLLVLPELAFSGYNFRSLQHISPFLEPTTAGITSLWARTTALKYDCVVSVGYPEKVDVTPKWPASPEYYNSAVVVNGDGETIANYRKSFLYYADETWALEGPDGFFDGDIHGLGKVAMGICMDLNPYRFEAPWAAWEFGYHILHKEANLVILSMAWLTREDARSFSRSPKDPDMDTLSYWLARLEPLIRAETEGEIIVVIANRTGTEDEAVYAGTSAVLGIHAGEVKLYGILGRGEKELLVVDTCTRPQAKLIADVDMSPVMSPAMSPAMSPTVSLGLGRQKSEDSSNRTKSVSSEESVLSIVTQATADTSPSSINHAMTIDGMATPVSPVHPTSPGLFFAPKGPAPEDRLAGGLTSSIGIELQGFNDALPNSPCAPRPASPKSRNASRTRHRKEHNVNLTSHNLPAGQLNQTAFDVTLPMSPASAVFDWHSTIDLFQPSVTPLNLGLWSGRTLTRRRSTLW